MSQKEHDLLNAAWMRLCEYDPFKDSIEQANEDIVADSDLHYNSLFGL